MIVAIALLHRDGMSSMLGGSLSCRISLASGIGVFSGGGEGRSVCCWGLACCCRWAEFLSLVRRCICLVSAFFNRWAEFFGFRGRCLLGHWPYCLCMCVVFVNNVSDVFRCFVDVCWCDVV